MSTTMQGIDAREYLSGWLKGLTGMTIADIKAIPEDKWTATFGGCTRPANEIVADTINLLYWTTAALKSEDADVSEEYMKDLGAKINTKEAAIATFTSACEDFEAALRNATNERLTTVVTPPWQMPAPLFMLCQIAVSHIWYHDGQLNYIQCLLGDEKIHWMGDEN
jgi:hypothetical protein